MWYQKDQSREVPASLIIIVNIFYIEFRSGGNEDVDEQRKDKLRTGKSTGRAW